MAKPTKTLKFEQAISQLEKTIEELEGGDLPLEEALKMFEKGMELTRYCENKITEAEGTLEVLLKEKGGVKEVRSVKLRDGYSSEGFNPLNNLDLKE